MIRPTVHLNGTPRRHLSVSLDMATGEIEQAILAMNMVAPNARDYYPQGPDAYSTAAREHADRVRRLRSVLEELTILREDVDAAP